LQSLLSKKQEIERNLSNSEPSLKDNEINALRQDLQNINKQLLDLLEEKNRMFEELTAQTKELLALNLQIQQNVEETSRFKQELEFLKREYVEKDKILGTLHAEIEEKQKVIDLLRAELEKRQREFDELQNVLREALSEGKDLDGMIEDRDWIIAELEEILRSSKGWLKDF